MKCPKCSVESQPNATECPRCGVVFARYGSSAPQFNPRTTIPANVPATRSSGHFGGFLLVLFLAIAGGAIWFAARSSFDRSPEGADLNALTDQAHQRQQKAQRGEFSSDSSRQAQERVLERSEKFDERSKASQLEPYVIAGLIFALGLAVYWFRHR